MKKNSKKQIINRMSILIGHLQANKKMIEDDRHCTDIIRQNNAVIAAIGKVNDLILTSYLEVCATSALKDGDIKNREKVLSEILAIFRAK